MLLDEYIVHIAENRLDLCTSITILFIPFPISQNLSSNIFRCYGLQKRRNMYVV